MHTNRGTVFLLFEQTATLQLYFPPLLRGKLHRSPKPLHTRMETAYTSGVCGNIKPQVLCSHMLHPQPATEKGGPPAVGGYLWNEVRVYLEQCQEGDPLCS